MRDTDATLVLRPAALGADPGSDWASRWSAIRRTQAPPRAVRDWLDEQAVNVLNVAGPSEGTAPGIGGRVEALLRAVFGSLYS